MNASNNGHGPDGNQSPYEPTNTKNASPTSSASPGNSRNGTTPTKTVQQRKAGGQPFPTTPSTSSVYASSTGGKQKSTSGAGNPHSRLTRTTSRKPATPAVEHISWTALPARTQATLVLIATPISHGYTEHEVARMLGLSSTRVSELMDELRDAILKQRDQQ